MTGLLNEKPDKLYFSIGEVAKYLKVNSSLLRYWDKEFDIIQPKKNAKGNRLFTREDVKNIGIIYNLVKERGFTIEGAKKKLKNNNQQTVGNVEIINRLEAIKAELINIKKHLS